MIHFNSSSFTQIQLQTPSSPQPTSNPISDMESDNQSVNQNLCESFEGLMKKDELDCSTRNTQWSQSEKGNCGAAIQGNDGQNQNQQKIICFTTVWKFHDDPKQENKKVQKTKLDQQKINTIKKTLTEKRNQKVNKLRSLLPHYYSMQLPAELRDMLKTAQLIDKYLLEKKSADYIDNVHNIFKTLFFEEEMSSIWSTVKRIIFLSEDYFRVRVDPLKNLCLGFVTKKDAKLGNRKERLRMAVGEYYCKHKDSFLLEDMAEAYVEPLKTIKFYPENLNIQAKTIEKKIKPQYIEQLKSRIKTKQTLLNHSNLTEHSASPESSSQTFPSLQQLKQFCQSICKIYSQRQVGHMYKTSLIQNLRKHSSFDLEKIFMLLKYIQSEGLFLQVLVKSSCHIFRIVEKEKTALLEILELKNKHQHL